MEIWRAIPGQPFYEASSYGRVRSVDKTVAGRFPGFTRRAPGRVLKLFDNGKYLTVMVNRRTHCAHELVALAFHGPAPRPGLIVRHVNGRRLNIRPDNLRWGSHKQNQRDRISHGTTCRGENSYRAVLTKRQVLRIMKLRATLGPTAIAKAVGCERRLVKHVIYGQSWNWLTQLPRSRRQKKGKLNG